MVGTNDRIAIQMERNPPKKGDCIPTAKAVRKATRKAAEKAKSEPESIDRSAERRVEIFRAVIKERFAGFGIDRIDEIPMITTITPDRQAIIGKIADKEEAVNERTKTIEEVTTTIAASGCWNSIFEQTILYVLDKIVNDKSETPAIQEATRRAREAIARNEYQGIF